MSTWPPVAELVQALSPIHPKAAARASETLDARVRPAWCDIRRSAAIKARADLSQLDVEIEAQARRVDMVRAEYWPVVSAKGTYGSRLSLQGEYDDLGFVGL
jgi:outer membrane protein TolC